MKARDGQTELYGFMFKPTNLDPARKYPIVNYVYPGPQIGSCGGRTFTAAHGDLQSLADYLRVEKIHSRRADEMLERGDRGGQLIWLRIRRAIIELQAMPTGKPN